MTTLGSAMACRPGCGACCIAPSISSTIPGQPGGKPAGARCVQLTPEHRCRLFGRPERPAVCAALRPSPDMCGHNREEALAWLARLERLTRPGGADLVGQAEPSRCGGCDQDANRPHGDRLQGE